MYMYMYIYIYMCMNMYISKFFAVFVYIKGYINFPVKTESICECFFNVKNDANLNLLFSF